MLKRTSIIQINSILEKNPQWKILDIGCGYRAHKNASVIADIQDLSDHYKDRNFIQIKEKIFPFKDNEFDFVIASHVIEHVKDFQFFINELERVASKGYIELPTRLADNLVFENEKDHLWWFRYDDINNKIIASKKKQLLKSFITVSMAKLFEDTFRESMVTEIIWENKIDLVLDEKNNYENFKKISFFKIFKKYLSKKLRNLIK